MLLYINTHTHTHTYIHTYTNTGAPKYANKILTDIKEEIDSNIKTVEDFNTTFTSIERSSRQNRETLDLHVTLDQVA